MKFTKKKKWILTAFIIIVVSIFIFYFQGGYTSAAYIRANWTEISPRVEEFVTNVNVGTNDFVKKGQALFQLDPYAYELKVEDLQAQIDLAKAKKKQYEDEVKDYQIQLDASTNSLKLDSIEVNRYKWLSNKQANSVESYQDKLDQYEKDNVQRAQIQTILDDTKNYLIEQNAIINQLEAQLKLAKFNLESTTIIAPYDGYTVNNYLMPGMYLHAGDKVFGVVQTQECWVEANFKEFWIGKIKPGQKVWILADLYPFTLLHGEVVSIVNAVNRTDSQDKILPYIEPTIDWIRLQYRFTVIIKIINKPNYVNLKMGSSARVYIWFW